MADSDFDAGYEEGRRAAAEALAADRAAGRVSYEEFTRLKLSGQQREAMEMLQAGKVELPPHIAKVMEANRAEQAVRLGSSFDVQSPIPASDYAAAQEARRAAAAETAAAFS